MIFVKISTYLEYKTIVEIQSSDEQSLNNLLLDIFSILGPNRDLLVQEEGNLYLQGVDLMPV
jgi:hypothetical protein